MERKRLGRDGAERLARIDVLRDLSIGQRRQLAGLADEVTARAGDVLLRQGDPGYEFMMLEEGQADVLRDGERINTMGPGDCFGELAILSDGEPRSASVIATTEVRAMVLTAHFMREVHDRMPSAGARIERVAADRMAADAERGTSYR